MRGLKENSTTYKILIKISEILEAVGTLIIWDFETISKTTGITSLYRDPSLYPKLSKSLYELKRRNYIKGIKTKKGKGIKLTPKGKMEILRYKIKIKTEKPKWDKKWHAISWDVPEISRNDRDYLRRMLRWLGFKELQKSLWVFPFDVKGEIKELIKFYKENLAGDVRFLTIEKIEKDSDLIKYFKL